MILENIEYDILIQNERMDRDCLNELVELKFVMKLKNEFDTHGQEPVRTEYRLLSNEIQKLSYHIGRSTGAEKERLLEEYNRKRKLMSPREPSMPTSISW